MAEYTENTNEEMLDEVDDYGVINHTIAIGERLRHGIAHRKD